MAEGETFEEMMEKLLPEEIDKGSKKWGSEFAVAAAKKGELFQGSSAYQPKLSKEEVNHLETYFQAQEGSPIASMALICKWDQCVYKDACPLYQIKPQDTPEGKPCPVELTLLYRDLNRYMDELDISATDVVDISILKEYLMWNLYAKRAREEMAMDPQILRRNFITLDRDGEPIYQEQLNPIFNMLEKQSRTKQKLLASLMATREAKAKDANSKQKGFHELAKVFRTRVEEHMKRKREEEIIDLDVREVHNPPTDPDLPEPS